MSAPAPWIIVETTSKSRINVFCVERGDARHVASITSASSHKIEQFRIDVELMRRAPELYTLLREAADVFIAMNHICDPQLVALRDRILSTVYALEDSFRRNTR